MIQCVALLTPENEVLVSRNRHDYVQSSDKSCAIDSGQLNYFRVIGGGKIIYIELPLTLLDLELDFRNRTDKYCRFKLEDVKVIDEKEWVDKNTLEWKSQNFYWGFGEYEGKPAGTKLLKDLETEHLENILALNYISEDYRMTIEYILNQRKEEKFWEIP